MLPSRPPASPIAPASAAKAPGWLSRWTRRVALKEADGWGATVLTSPASLGDWPLAAIRQRPKASCGFSARSLGAPPDGGSGWSADAAVMQIELDARELRPVLEFAEELGLDAEELQPYGRYAAKIELTALDRLADAPAGQLVCVTSVTPTKAGEGKTTTAISLVDGLGRIGERPMLALREPSLGPVFGIKGGGTGGGRAQLAPMELINLHFTGDIHAIGAANNLLAADRRVAPAARQRARAGPALGHVAPLPRHGRSRAAKDRRRARRPRERRAAGDRLRHHGSVRGDGDRCGRARPRRPARAARRDHGRHDFRGRAGDSRAARLRGLDGRAAHGRAQAEPRPDARGTAGARPLRPLREHRARQQLVARRPARAEARATTSSPRAASARRWASRSSSTSSAGSAGSRRAASCSSRPSQALKHHGGDPDGGVAALERGAANLAANLAIVREFGLEPVVAVNRHPG